MHKGIDLIQLLRGVAALLVCFFHMKGILPENHLGQKLFGNGSVGVPLFFMISGFIMVHTTRNMASGWSSIRWFLHKRLARILPLYLICTVISISILDQWFLYIHEHPERLVRALLFIPSFHILLGPSYGFPPLAVGWSLNYEMYFYLLLAVSLLIPRRRWFWICSFLAAFVWLIPFLKFGYISQTMTHAYPFSWKYLNLMCNPVLLFFLSGIVSGLIYHRINPGLPIWLANGFMVVASLVFILTYARIWLPLPGIGSYLLSSWLLLFSVLVRHRIQAMHLPGLLVFPGDVSYSLYLIHPLVITGVPRILDSLKLPIQTSGWLYFFTILLLTLILSYHSYQLIEQRFGKWLLAPNKKPAE